MRGHEQCIEGGEGSLGVMVEYLRDTHVRVQGAVLSVARLGGNSCAPLAPGSCPTLDLAVSHPSPPNSVMFVFAWILD